MIQNMRIGNLKELPKPVEKARRKFRTSFTTADLSIISWNRQKRIPTADANMVSESLGHTTESGFVGISRTGRTRTWQSPAPGQEWSGALKLKSSCLLDSQQPRSLSRRNCLERSQHWGHFPDPVYQSMVRRVKQK